MPNFEVKIRCVVEKIVFVECETKEDARKNPWEHFTDEIETDMMDWDVLSVKEDD